MLRRHAGRIVCFVLVVLISGSVCHAAVQKVRISDLASTERMAAYNGQRVAVRGTVQQPQVLTPDWDAARAKRFRGQYMLSDGSDSITVRSLRLPPPAGQVVAVRGIWDARDTAAPVLIQQGWPVSPVLVAALAVLVVLAVVLIVLLVRSGRREHTPHGADAYVSPVPMGDSYSTPVVPSGAVCRSCHRPLRPGDAFCEHCGATVDQSSPVTASSPTTDQTIMVDANEPALADLTVVSGADGLVNKVFPLHTAKQIIGRAQDAQICLGNHDQGISRNHACILWEDGAFFIQDLASTSGTHVNDQRVIKQALKNDDIVKLGRTKLVFRDLRRV